VTPHWRGRQFHNQPEKSHQHGFLVDLWDEVRQATAGRLDIAVHAGNAGVPGSDPQVLDMLIGGELEFATMMGPLIATRVPAAEIQGIPFAFNASAEAHRAVDGALGEHLRREMAAKGIYLMPAGALENGFRQICSVSRPVTRVEDLAGYRMRVPNGALFRELFAALGAEPVVVNVADLYQALAEKRVDGHENPLAITDANQLDEVTRFVSVTNHVWSAFNLIAQQKFWKALPEDVQGIVQRATHTHIGRQRAYTVALNNSLEQQLVSRGMIFNTVDTDGFRARLAGGFYAGCRERCGAQAWRLLEEAAGKLPA
jgi:tripartite ATP-independent transporter DctP family solute receptor